MIKKLKVKGYRGFQSYEMDGLARVNLLVGKNNSGKTALLEALAFLTAGGAPAELASIAARRGEWAESSDEGDDTPNISHFFYGHEIEEDTSFKIEADNGHTPAGVRIASITTKERDFFLEGGRVNARGQLKMRFVEGRGEGDDEGIPVWAAHFEGSQVHQDSRAPIVVVSSRGTMLSEFFPSRRRLLDQWGSQTGSVFVTTASLSDRRLAQLWKTAELEAKTDNALHAIRMLASDVSRIVVVPSSSYRGADWFISTEGRKRPVPIGSYGDGMRRLLGLALAMVGAAGSTFLVDELDTGLHFSAMTDVWRMVIGTAQASNTQVFATTHSWDCIAGLSELLQVEDSLREHVAIHKVDRRLPCSIAMDGEAVARISKQHIDPR